MKIPAIILLFCVAAFSGCSRHGEPAVNRQPDPALQTALDELTRLKSVTEVELTYGEYSERVLTAKGNIDVALMRTSDAAAKARIKTALGWYLAARNQWQAQNGDVVTSDIQTLWRDADDATRKAYEYALADETARKGIEQREAETLKQENEARTREAALENENKKVSAEIEAARNQLKEAAAKEEAELEKQQAAEAAAREHARRYAPEGTGFNVRPIPVASADTVTTIPPGTQLSITAKNPDGTVHVKMGDFETNVPATEITNDRDLAAKLRANEQNEQEAIRQWRTEQAAAIEEARQAAARATPAPSPAADDGSSSLHVKPDYVSPLERKAY